VVTQPHSEQEFESPYDTGMRAVFYARWRSLRRAYRIVAVVVSPGRMAKTRSPPGRRRFNVKF
ncbi:MAG: hypothetical protein ACYS0K_24420, partial [Planctomycetota bacterium]